MPRNLIAGIGNVMQLAFVPADVDAALKYWTQTMGAGPFVALDHVQMDAATYKGAPVAIDFSVYIGYWGDLQIEIIAQHDDTPSIYKSWRDEGCEGLHHVCLITSDMAKARRIIQDAGGTVVQEAFLPGGVEAFYAETGGGPGTMVEVLQPNQAILDAFAHIKSLSVGWDGADPVRRLG
ncbi:glyoxalase [Acidocella aquatica]|uniref:Glyoxalase n=1 Tax=Acidocella aquatica TaxID=1922313 RepID=A0ABQ6AEU2_9PROT|nr:VOC family protein [Acidocella aquatica]GLR68555.1 glyoxalase [Acidocella aquatica]